MIISEKQCGLAQESAMAKGIGGHSAFKSCMAIAITAIPMAPSVTPDWDTNKVHQRVHA